MFLEDLSSGKNLLPKFEKKAISYFKKQEDRFESSKLNFKVYKELGYFPHACDNHIGEYLQFIGEFAKIKDIIDWINRTDYYNQAIHKRGKRYYKRLKKVRYPKKGCYFEAHKKKGQYQ